MIDELLELNKEPIKFLTDIGITATSDIIEALEAYKFASRSEILSYYDKSVMDVEKYEPFATDVEDKYGVCIQKVDESEDEVYVYVPLDVEVDVTGIELELNFARVFIIYVTPLNFKQLLDPNYKYDYNSDILFKRILMEAIKLHATDLHFDVKHVNMQAVYTVSYRRDADIVPMNLFKLDQNLNSSIISKLIEQRTSASSLDLLDPSGVVCNASNILGNDDIELRISANRVKDGYHYVIRIQQKQTFSFTLNKLGFADKVYKDLEEITRKRSGITLITGAIRTGKNTTAFALANEMLNSPIKMISYESPIEVLMPFTQIDYLGDEKVLVNAVRLAKKQDINVAFLNEIPNKEVAFAIKDLANSSIHVITTMHMNRIWHLPYKLKEYYGDEYKDIISQINGVFNQKMFGVNCPDCKKRVLTSEVRPKYQEMLNKYNITQISISGGCENCNNLGTTPGKNQPYSEHLLFTEEIVDKLLACDHPYEMETIIRDEVRSNNQSLEDYMSDGFRRGSIPLYAIDHL